VAQRQLAFELAMACARAEENRNVAGARASWHAAFAIANGVLAQNSFYLGCDRGCAGDGVIGRSQAQHRSAEAIG
jgi:hypothetical protein